MIFCPHIKSFLCQFHDILSKTIILIVIRSKSLAYINTPPHISTLHANQHAFNCFNFNSGTALHGQSDHPFIFF